MIKQRTGDRSWLDGSSRTWRWNQGTYEQRDSYDAVEAGPNGLAWYHWDHRHGDGGAQSRQQQSHADFTQSGPLRPIPDALRSQLQQWLKDRGY